MLEFGVILYTNESYQKNDDDDFMLYFQIKKYEII